MIPRVLQPQVLKSAEFFPVVSVTGPRQSGKTTLCRMAFPGKAYVSLEDPMIRRAAREDPRAFFGELARGAILDEVQRAPELASYLQGIVDQRRVNGEWILTGSENFNLARSLSQSLAGRTAVHHLLPLGLEELRLFPAAPRTLYPTLFAGGYPRIHEQGIPPGEWLGAYVATYLERDVRELLNIGQQTTFHTFLQLCAGRNGQVINYTSLAADCGVSPNTVKSWISILEASFIVFRLPPLLPNWNKRLTRLPKLYFCDTGLACHLLGLRDPAQVHAHPLRGAIFEGWVVSEILKARLHRGLRNGLAFYRDREGLEIDLVVELGNETVALEIKSSATFDASFFEALDRFEAIARRGPRSHLPLRRMVVYGGDEPFAMARGTVVPWQAIDDFNWAT